MCGPGQADAVAVMPAVQHMHMCTAGGLQREAASNCNMPDMWSTPHLYGLVLPGLRFCTVQQGQKVQLIVVDE
jgi:hypothetical protein